MPTKPRVFVSYSSRDFEKADKIRAALEAAGMPCWIAPRDLSAGTQWGGGIVQAINVCEAVVVVFSDAANGSPQVAREMELSVSRKLPLIPVRIADVMPTDDMQFFLGVSHWFNAYPKPIETYLPDIVAATRRVLEGERDFWKLFQKRLPRSRAGQVVLTGVAAALVAALVGLFMQPHFPTGPQADILAGRWKAKLTDADHKPIDCEMDVQKMGLITFSDFCPDPLGGVTGGINLVKDSSFAPNLFKPGDTGTFQILGGSVNGYAVAFKLGWFGGLTIRDPRLGDIKWSKAAADKPMASEADQLLPNPTQWPPQNTTQIAANALAYMQGKWQSDAVLMSLDLKPATAAGGTIGASFTFFSPGQQQERTLHPGSPAGLMDPPYSRQDDAREALPAQFLDLTDAVARAHGAGMKGKDIGEAKLAWTGGESCGTGNFAIDNAILPRCKPGRFIGPQWEIDSALNERMFVPAR
jgi:hypothetical protein